ncbi:MAG: hypothetical protein CL957_07435 [Euryarchaeota archaeon]|nr:hypothetical protein [Euryarchaeota archaeon]
MQLRPQDEKLSAKNRIAGMNAKVFIGSPDARALRRECKQNLPDIALRVVSLYSCKLYSNPTL